MPSLMSLNIGCNQSGTVISGCKCDFELIFSTLLPAFPSLEPPSDHIYRKISCLLSSAAEINKDFFYTFWGDFQSDMSEAMFLTSNFT